MVREIEDAAIDAARRATNINDYSGPAQLRDAMAAAQNAIKEMQNERRAK